MQQNPFDLATEESNPATTDLDQLSSLAIVQRMNYEDATVAAAISCVLPNIAKLIDRVAEILASGGRLFYAAAGTSGRLAMLDSAECPPTFGVDPDRVQCLMAGGEAAFRKSIEGVEDSVDAGCDAVKGAGLTSADALVGIAASGRTPFVVGAIRCARESGSFTAAISNCESAQISREAELSIEAPVGPEVLAGSTRLKAGTAQKMILNMISTGAMIRLGKVYGNLMVDVQATNQKLRFRAVKIVAQIAGVSMDRATELLDLSEGSTRQAIVMGRTGCDKKHAETLLSDHHDNLRNVLDLSRGPEVAADLTGTRKRESK